MGGSLRVLVSGSSGLVGKALCLFLQEKGHKVVHLKRKTDQAPEKDAISWDPETGEGNASDFEGFDVVVHLAGESLAKGFWTLAKKKRILESRSVGTSYLVSLLAKTTKLPKLFLSASAIGYYGSREEAVTEKSLPGQGFLSEVCQAWESASILLQEKGVRVVRARLGVVLSFKGGLLKALLPVFRFGLGGKVGSGEQKISWIALEDVVAAFYHVMVQDHISGPVNVVSPNPVSQKVFAKTLASVLRKPSFFVVPSSLLFGEKAKVLILASQQVIPVKLLESGFSFSFPDLEKTLRYNLPD